MAANSIYEAFCDVFHAIFVNPELPNQMRRDPALRDLKVSGPLNLSHQRIRQYYYSIRDNKPLPQVRNIEDDFKFVCQDSPELFNRNDDYPTELRTICGVVGHHLAKSKQEPQAPL